MRSRIEPLDLKEYESSDPLELDDSMLSGLQTLPPDRVSVLAADRSGWYVVRAGSWVGTIVVPGLTIRIRPKVQDLRNVLMMLSAGCGLASWSLDTVPYAADDLVEGIAELVLREIDSATRQGVIRGYQPMQERVPAIRGRLMVEALAFRPWDILPAPCEFAEFTADVAENRVLRSVVRLLHGWVLNPALRRQALVVLQRLDEVCDVATPLLELDRVQTSRLNGHYEAALNLSRLVLEGIGVSHLAGAHTAHSFLIDMNSLFERWIGAELTVRLWPDIEVAEQVQVPLSETPRVTMRPDLLFCRGQKRLFVGDVKYKLTSTGLSRTEDYYQLLAYVTALRLHRGMLIYCQAAEAPPRSITVVGGRQELLCHPFSLEGTSDDISDRLDQLTDDIRRAVLTAS